MCTIANTPRLPEHCVEYVRVIQWSQDQPFGGRQILPLLSHFYYIFCWITIYFLDDQSLKYITAICSDFLN